MLAKPSSAEIVDRLVRAPSMEAGRAVMARSLAAFDLEHFAYVALPTGTLADAPKREPLVATTYSQEWQKTYLTSGFAMVDPVFAAGSRDVVPFDWRDLDRSDRQVRDFFGAAGEHGVGARGLTVPARHPHGGFSIFSINADLGERAWRRLVREFLHDFLVVAHVFDTCARTHRDRAVALRADRLTRRERECLSWSAAGKDTWETSVILGVSERTVRFHLLNARVKLDAVNTTQAVALAIHVGAIDLP